MATVFGSPGDEIGDKQVFQALQTLPLEAIVYAQPTLVHKTQRRYPDYVVLHPDWGVIVLEVKDWYQIRSRDRKGALVLRMKSGKEEWEESPVEQARKAAIVISNMLCEDPNLRNYAGKLDFPYRYAGMLPNLPGSTISWLEKEWGENYVIGRDDLKPERITKKISSIPAPFSNRITEAQLNCIRAIIDPRNKVIDHATGTFKGVYDPIQEVIAKELLRAESTDDEENTDLYQSSFELPTNISISTRIEHIESNMPVEVSNLKKSSYIRLIRGYAGTGKTDILILRTHYLYEIYPDIQILVTTFNKPIIEKRLKIELGSLKDRVDVISFDSLCADIFKRRHGQFIKPQSTEGVISKLAETETNIDEFGIQFITDEIIWLKESGLTNRRDYINAIREGRGGKSGRSLSKNMKNRIFNIYDRYQQELSDLPAHDWVDLHEKTLTYLQEGTDPERLYDVILIDEAQHFAPTWMHIISYYLKEKGSLFISDDPSQSVYRLFSWRQRGVDVVGRTRWLRIPYRNTQEIFEAAYSLITSNSTAQDMFNESGEYSIPDLDNSCMRHGDLPEVHCFRSFATEKEFVCERIKSLVTEGILPQEICILHTKKHVIEAYRRLLSKEIVVDNLRRQTGMEYKAVFIPRIQDLFDRDIEYAFEEDSARQQLMFYMAMTRARDHLYLLYGQKWPKVFDPIHPKVNWIDHK